MDRALILFACLLSFLCYAQRDVYMDFVKPVVIKKPTYTLKTLKNKKASQLFSPTNRLNQFDNREKHIQLSIDLFRKRKYSLLLKSMKSFENKYGTKRDYGLHEFFQIVVLEEKLGDVNPTQMISLSEKVLDGEFGSDLNFKFAVHKILLKYLIKNGDNKEFTNQLSNYLKAAKRVNSSEETSWAHRIAIEYRLENGKQVDRIPSTLTDVYQADYKVYQLVKNNEYSKVLETYFDQI